MPPTLEEGSCCRSLARDPETGFRVGITRNARRLEAALGSSIMASSENAQGA
jgi:hypothetical protein